MKDMHAYAMEVVNAEKYVCLCNYLPLLKRLKGVLK